MSYLSKKAKKYYSALLTKKLKTMGLEDEITLVPSGKKRKTLKLDEKGQPVMKDGKPELQDIDIPVAQNKLRSTVKRLCEQPIDVILSFLNMEAK